MKMKSEAERKAFILGMITAFAECVTNECKKLALSPPFYPRDLELVREEAEEIAREQAIHLWYEKNEDIPEPGRLNWFVLYKFPEALEAYRSLRKQGLNPATDFEAFFPVLSYGMVWREDCSDLYPEFREMRETQCSFERFLLRPGDWPIVAS